MSSIQVDKNIMLCVNNGMTGLSQEDAEVRVISGWPSFVNEILESSILGPFLF